MEYLQYKYVEVNSKDRELGMSMTRVLNLIINGIPSIQNKTIFSMKAKVVVLNLIINGIPSILTSNSF